jgi:F0F1-type ATP synthase alpha subunit
MTGLKGLGIFLIGAYLYSEMMFDDEKTDQLQEMNETILEKLTKQSIKFFEDIYEKKESEKEKLNSVTRINNDQQLKRQFNFLRKIQETPKCDS